MHGFSKLCEANVNFFVLVRPIFLEGCFLLNVLPSENKDYYYYYPLAWTSLHINNNSQYIFQKKDSLESPSRQALMLNSGLSKPEVIFLKM